MVRDLAVEAGLADAVSDGAEAVQHEALAVQDDRSEEETVDRVLTANEAAKASTEAMSRHSFALHLLHMIEPQD
jgi:hypothetical protein